MQASRANAQPPRQARQRLQQDHRAHQRALQSCICPGAGAQRSFNAHVQHTHCMSLSHHTTPPGRTTAAPCPPASSACPSPPSCLPPLPAGPPARPDWPAPARRTAATTLAAKVGAGAGQQGGLAPAVHPPGASPDDATSPDDAGFIPGSCTPRCCCIPAPAFIACCTPSPTVQPLDPPLCCAVQMAPCRQRACWPARQPPTSG
jgi:hypothetical protein